MEPYSVVCVWRTAESNDLSSSCITAVPLYLSHCHEDVKVCHGAYYLEEVVHVTPPTHQVYHNNNNIACHHVLTMHNMDTTPTNEVLQKPARVHDDGHANQLPNHEMEVLSSGSFCLVNLDAIFVKLVTQELKVSAGFRRGFFQYISSYYKWLNYNCSLGQTSKAMSHSKMPKILIVMLKWPAKCLLDYKWNYRVCDLVIKAIQLDDAMNWLNTLGGGYSALGDHSIQHAEQAGKVSFSQLKLAVEMGDPATVIRCYLYYSLSLMQTGKLHLSQSIIRKCFQRSKHLLISDDRLLAMCKGIWNRLKYIYSQRHLSNNRTQQINHKKL